MLHRLKAVASSYGLKPDRSAVRRTHPAPVEIVHPSFSGGGPFPPNCLGNVSPGSHSSKGGACVHALSSPTHQRCVSSQCRLKAWGLLIPYRGL